MSFFKATNGRRLLVSVVLGVFTISLMILFIFLIINGGKPESERYNIKLKNYTYYSISLGKYDSLERANIEADKIIVRGGAGYIAEFKGFNVLAALYASKSDAESVVKSLKNSDINAEIFIIEIPKIYVESEFDYSDGLSKLVATIDSLCDLYYKIDGEALSLGKARDELSNIIKPLEGYAISEKYADNIKGIRIKAEFKVMVNYLTNILMLESTELMSLKIKQVQFKIIYGVIDLFKEIAD